MLAIAYYLLKVIICSGILLGYYRIALHDKLFHRWNRFYLLGAVVISVILPLIRIDIAHRSATDEGQIVRLLSVVTTGDEYVYEASRSSGFTFSGEQVAMFGYLVVSLFFFLMLCHALLKLRKLIRHNPSQKIQHINLVNTDAKGTPFSFFRFIFWNRRMNMHSSTGEKIFNHEMVHVTEWHSADRLFMNLALIFFWCNPFFWLIRREMNMIHEFIADSKAIENNDTAVFAAMILHATYPQQAFGLTSNFFSSSIKRRLCMLTKLNNPRVNYFSRILALPLLTFVFVAFTIKTRPSLPEQNGSLTDQSGNPFKVVIDAGHGGDDGGARSKGGIREKDKEKSIAAIPADELPPSQIALYEQNSLTNSSSRSFPESKDLLKSSDTLQRGIKSVDITTDDQVIIIYNDNKAEKISKAEAKKRGVIPVAKSGIDLNYDKGQGMDSVLYFLEGVEISNRDREKIVPSEIESINVWRGQQAIDKFGQRAGHGAIEINLKKGLTEIPVQTDNKVFSKVETEAQFPGGDRAWSKFISNAISKVIDSLQKENKTGTCVVQFIVDTEGRVSDVEALTMKGTLLARTVADAVQKGPRWIPALQNGRKVTAYRRQPVTFQIAQD